MACNLLQDAACLAALSNNPKTPTNLQEINQVFSGVGMAGNFAAICSNMTNFGFTDCDGPVQAGNLSNASEVTFVLANYISALSKAVKLDPAMSTELINRVDEIWAMNDESLIAGGIQVPDLSGTMGPLVPYNSLTVPSNYDVNVPHKGWSRYAPPFLNPTDPSQQTARARIESLTDGYILSTIMEAVCCLDECGTLGAAKRNQWLADARTVIETHMGYFREDFFLNIDPSISGSPQTVSITGFIDAFGNIIPMNQQMIMFDSIVRYERCSGDTQFDIRPKVTKFLQTVDAYQFYPNSANPTGFYYSLKENPFEVPEDYGHTAITVRSLKAFAEYAISGTNSLTNKIISVLANNSYQGGGEFAWYNDGNTGHGTTANVTGQSPNLLINWGPMGSNAFNTSDGTATGTILGSGATGDQRSYHPFIWAELPDNILSANSTVASAALASFTNTGVINGSYTALATMCLAMEQCRDLTVIYPTEIINPDDPDPDPDPDPNPDPDDCVDSLNEETVVITRGNNDKTNAVELDFGMEDTCIEFGKASSTPTMPDNQYPYKNQSCNIEQKSCLSPHDSCFIWCNVCLNETATYSATGTKNGDPSNICDCEDGLFWSFATQRDLNTDNPIPASLTINVPDTDGTGCYADTVIIWNHNLCNKTTNRVDLYVDNIQLAQYIIDPNCSHCCGSNGNRCKPIYFYLENGARGVNWELRFNTDIGYVHSIGNVMVGVTFPIDLEAGFNNIFAGSRYTRANNTNTCGWFPSVLDEKIHEFDVPITEIEESWLIDHWYDFLWYAERYPFYFLLAKNNLPDLISRVRLGEQGVEASTYDDEICQSITIPLQGRLHPEENNFSSTFSCRTENGDLPVIQIIASRPTTITLTELSGKNLSEDCAISSPMLLNNVLPGNSVIVDPQNNQQLIVRIAARTVAGSPIPFSYTVTCPSGSGNVIKTCTARIEAV